MLEFSTWYFLILNHCFDGSGVSSASFSYRAFSSPWVGLKICRLIDLPRRKMALTHLAYGGVEAIEHVLLFAFEIFE